MPKVLNKYKDEIPADAVYIGRPSVWGNPFMIGKDGNRAEVVEKYREYIMNHAVLLTHASRELRGKDLVCFCSPHACHGDILIEIANKMKGD